MLPRMLRECFANAFANESRMLRERVTNVYRMSRDSFTNASRMLREGFANAFAHGLRMGRERFCE